MKLLKDGKIIDTPWLRVEDRLSYPEDDWLVLPLESFLRCTSRLKNKESMGVWLDTHESVEELSGLVNELPVIALNFPQFTDGRAFSSAALLRQRYKYQGMLIATGDVRFDQMDQLYLTGFDAIDITNNTDFRKAEGETLIRNPGYLYLLDETVSSDKKPANELSAA